MRPGVAVMVAVLVWVCWPSADEAFEQETGGGGVGTSQTLDP